MVRRLRSIVVVIACLALTPDAHAQPTAPPTDGPRDSKPSDAARDRARTEFLRGADLVKEAKWAEALAAFEASFALVPHPVTSFNIGACERATGSYARARRTLLATRALDARGDSGNLPDSARADITAFLSEIDAILVTVEVHLDPPSAAIAVDGRPLERTTDGDNPIMTAGLAPPGPGRPPSPSGRFRLELDPGAHVIVLQRPGFQDVVRREVFARGNPRTLDLVLEKLDATLRVAADQERAAVSIDGIDVGLAPIELRRPAGRYHVAVRKAGFVSYETDAQLEAGGRVDLSALLPEETTPLYKKWWFWAAAGGVVAAATTTTYFLVRPDPERPAANGGGLGWVVRVP